MCIRKEEEEEEMVVWGSKLPLLNRFQDSGAPAEQERWHTRTGTGVRAGNGENVSIFVMQDVQELREKWKTLKYRGLRKGEPRFLQIECVGSLHIAIDTGYI